MIGAGERSSNQARHDHVARGTVVGFFTDPTLCIGCKACEVACKEWNQLEGDGIARSGLGYDHTQALGASTWRHVLFLEQDRPKGRQVAGPMTGDGGLDAFRWIFLSDVCKHCEVAGCLEACPTGAIVRTETGGVFVQDDVCNGCGYCVVTCPFGVVDRRDAKVEGGGGAFKCTFCYDRQKDGLVPACAKACPTESIRFGPLEDLRAEAQRRVDELHAQGLGDARLYDPTETSVGGLHAFFLLLGEPEAFGLPEHPEAPTALLRASWTSALATSAAAILAAFLAFALSGPP